MELLHQSVPFAVGQGAQNLSKACNGFIASRLGANTRRPLPPPPPSVEHDCKIFSANNCVTAQYFHNYQTFSYSFQVHTNANVDVMIPAIPCITFISPSVRMWNKRERVVNILCICLLLLISQRVPLLFLLHILIPLRWYCDFILIGIYF